MRDAPVAALGGVRLSRLVVVSNRVAPIQEGRQASGGLAVAVLDALSEIGGVWFGWSGEILASGGSRVQTETKDGITYATRGLARREYDAISNGNGEATMCARVYTRQAFVGGTRKHGCRKT